MTNKPRGVLIAGNWKMNLGPAEAARFFADLGSLAEKERFTPAPGLAVVVIPPALSIDAARRAAGALKFPVAVAAQNAHWEKKGAFTGELSGPMLREAGLDWVLIGHSERRQYFGETDETVRRRAESLLEQGFRVILCIGETRAEREAGLTRDILTRQIQGALPEKEKGAAAYLDGRLVLAYEPVWAIGTGLTATPEQAEETHQVLRKLLWERFSMESAARTPILYGGSVTPENVDSLLRSPNVDGALVGGASLKPESFFALVRAGNSLLS